MKDSNFNHEKSYINSWYKIRKSFDKFFRENSEGLDINPAEARFLSEIYYNEGISQREISHNLFVSEANTAKTFKKLEEKELIYKNIDEENNTRRQLHLSEKGKDVFEKTINIYEEYEKIIFKNQNEDDLKLSEEIFANISRNTLQILK